MSRTVFCVATAALLAVVAMATMVARQRVLGDEVKVPTVPGTWKVTLLVTGRGNGDGRLTTATPLDFGRQHIYGESCASKELLYNPPDARHPDRRRIVWTQRLGQHDAACCARYEFYCVTNCSHPSPAMNELAQALYAAPGRGEWLQRDAVVETDNAEIAELARQLTTHVERPEDAAEALFRYVDQEVASEPSVVGRVVSAVECLKQQSGDSSAKSRLLAALCRNRGIPARLVTGLTLARDSKQVAQRWLEVWVRDQWLPMDPFAHHFGQVPRTYVVFGFGDLSVIRGRNVRNLEYSFLVERLALDTGEVALTDGWQRRLFKLMSFNGLPPTEQRLVEFLLLLPVAALIVCLFRNIIGLSSFGTFAPALLGLAFRELHSMPGILVFTLIVLTGWLIRRVLDRYHLLQVPRMAVMLSLVVVLLISAITLAGHHNMPATKYVSLFPMVILVGMIERFWTLETEDGTTSSFKTLLQTMVIVASISLVLSIHPLLAYLFHYPESLGLIMAIQLLIGRYTGYRLMELYRFRDFLKPSAACS